MTPAGLVRLLLLAALWGGSFLFMRMTASVLGPAWLIFARVALAALFLWIVAIWLKKLLEPQKHWRHYLVLGLFNSALPFFLLAYAAQTISASLLSILNATSPIWAALIARLWFKQRLSLLRALGMGFGLVGVVVLTGIQSLSLSATEMLSIAAALSAALSYGVASNYTKIAPDVEAFSNAHGSMWAASLIMIPFALSIPAPIDVPLFPAGAAVLALGVLCSGVAYLIYFRLVADVGAASALTVTFLVPVFATLWGAWLLHEPITWATVSGGALVLVGTALATGFSWRALVRRK